MTTQEMIKIISARMALFAAADAQGETDTAQLHAAAFALLEIERRYPELQAHAFKALAGPREEWEIA